MSLPEPKDSAEIVSQLRAMNALLIASLQRQHDMRQNELIQLLDSAGLPAIEIARLLGTTSNTVSVTLSKGRAKNSIKAKRA